MNTSSMPKGKPDPEQILRVGLGFWASKALLSAVEMEVFTQLARRPGTSTDLQGRLGLHPRSARDFLDALVALGFIERREGTYFNTPSSDVFLDKHKPSYIGGILEMANHRLFHHWGTLTEGLRTGLPQNEMKGTSESTFAALYADPARLKEFLKGDERGEPGREPGDCGEISLGGLHQFVDAGTAQGDLAVTGRAGQSPFERDGL